jgi:anti-sigma factor ChrR (cupin superfamily)
MSGRGHQDIFAADIEWRPGSDDGVSYARFPLDEANPAAPLIILSRFAAGAEVGPHTHGANYFEYIIEGEQTVGKTTFRQGDVRLVKGGTGYGPIKVGPQGCTVLIVFQEAARAVTEPLPRKKDAMAA